MLLKKDQYVKNNTKPEWGIGKVIEIKNQDRAEVFFQYAGFKTFVRKKNNLVEVDATRIDNTIFDNLHNISDDNQVSKLLFRDIPTSKEYFLKNYPDGFKGEKYKDRESDYKDSGHDLAKELLNQQGLEELLKNNDYEEIVSRAMKVINKLNLLFPNEKMALKDGIKDTEAKEKFSKSLYGLLYGNDSLQKRFEGWVVMLKSIGAAKWTTVSN
jgi:hypothetical protein